MPVADIFNTDGAKIGEITLNDKVFGNEVNTHLLHAVIRAQLLNSRGGNASTKTRGEVRGGGRKPWRQKHTGRARVGSIRSPLWTGGGTVFGPRPRDWSTSIPKKAKRKALWSALSAKFKANKLLVLEEISLNSPKTRDALGILKKLGVKNALILIDKKNDNLEKSLRNLQGVDLLPCESINAYDVLKHDSLVCTRGSIEKIERIFGQ